MLESSLEYTLRIRRDPIVASALLSGREGGRRKEKGGKGRIGDAY